MKRIVILFILILLPIGYANAATLNEVSLKRCVDGDTALFLVDGEELKFRFLAIDTPESVHPNKDVEEGGKEASNYTCELLTNAKKIEVEYDEKAGKTDKYGRNLAWIYVDGVNLQKTLVENGYAEVAYIYGKYAYVDELCELQSKAIENKLGIWEDGKRKEGYCKTKSNKTTNKRTSKKTTKKKTSEEEEIIDMLVSKYGEKALIPIAMILVICYLFTSTKKRRKK